MAKEELFKIPVLKQAILLYGAYPVKRGAGDRAAIRSALSYLENGWATGVFLEGTRTADGIITEPKLGAALIAAKARAPLIPVSLWGTERIVKKGSIIPNSVPLTVRIGKVIDPPQTRDREDLEALTQKCADIINGMHDLGR
jgi:1-acyl-sn-glycerol-3-phosphate acyltransferase